MTEYTGHHKTRAARMGEVRIGIDSNKAGTLKKIKIQNLMRKFYGKTKSRYTPDSPNPFPYVFHNKRKKKDD